MINMIIHLVSSSQSTLSTEDSLTFLGGVLGGVRGLFPVADVSCLPLTVICITVNIIINNKFYWISKNQ